MGLSCQHYRDLASSGLPHLAGLIQPQKGGCKRQTQLWSSKCHKPRSLQWSWLQKLARKVLKVPVTKDGASG